MKSLALGFFVLLALSEGQEVRVEDAAPVVPDSDRTRPIEPRDLNRFLFFAALEGLVIDGVPDETVARILEMKDNHHVNFVYACQICHPMIEALKAYAMREKFFYGRKLVDPLVGKPTLPAEISLLLDHSDPVKRREGIGRLVNRCVERRFKEMRYTEAEATPIRLALANAKKKGGVMSPAQRAEMKECPSCRGAAAGSPFR